MVQEIVGKNSFNKKIILLSGGGTAGHVIPNLAILPFLKEKGYTVHYMGSRDGMERALVEASVDEYHAVSTGKLRRYFDLRNFTAPFSVLAGIFQAVRILKKISPAVTFAKGGYVSFPAVVASWWHGIPVIIHESDFTPGLANRLSSCFATKICYTFPETANFLPEKKSVLTGIPIRSELFRGDGFRARMKAGFTDEKPVILVTGGSQGSKIINEKIRMLLPAILSRFNVFHLCGKGNLSASHEGLSGYRQVEYAGEEMADLLAMADIVVSRAGANTLFELLALRKPALLIPLSKKTSRGDQILNARSFEKQGFSMVLEEEEIMKDPSLLEKKIFELMERREEYIRRMEHSDIPRGVEKIIAIINDITGKK